MDLLKIYKELKAQLAELILDNNNIDDEDEWVRYFFKYLHEELHLSNMELIVLNCFTPTVSKVGAYGKNKRTKQERTLSMLYKGISKRVESLERDTKKQQELDYEKMISKLNI